MSNPKNLEQPQSGSDHSAMACRWLVGGGAMGELIRSRDWSDTPLGPIDRWSASLRTTVNLVLDSNFPIALTWGPQHIQLYNDGYWPICGGKHPRSLGQDFSECWASAFPVIGDAFRSALAGTTAFLEDQRMFLDRLGFLEETFFTFSFSPIRDESGRVAGLLHPATETTAKMLTQRRTRCLREVTERSVRATDLGQGLQAVAQALSESTLDVPVALCFLLDDQGRPRLAAATGLPDGSPGADAGVWPLAEAIATRSTVAIDVAAVLPGLVAAPYPEPLRMAFAMPVIVPSRPEPVAVVVAGASPRLPMNEAYRAFFDLLRDACATVIANCLVIESERRRAQALTEIDRAKTAFFSNVSHEFRTPLTLLLAPLEDALAQPAAPAPEQHARIEIAHRNGMRLLRLVNTLLDFSRVEAGRLRAPSSPPTSAPTRPIWPRPSVPPANGAVCAWRSTARPCPGRCMSIASCGNGSSSTCCRTPSNTPIAA